MQRPCQAFAYDNTFMQKAPFVGHMNINTPSAQTLTHSVGQMYMGCNDDGWPV